MLNILGNIISAASSWLTSNAAGVTAASTVANTINQQNAYNDQLRLATEQKQREDTAFQRMVTDKAAAGLSPYWSGTGSATAAQRVGNPASIDINPLLSLLTVLPQAKKLEAETQVAQSQSDYLRTQSALNLIEKDIKLKDLDWYERKAWMAAWRDIGVGAGGFGVASKAIMDLIKGFFPTLKGMEIKGFLEGR